MQNFRVLIVEDEPLVCRVIAEALQGIGLTVHHAYNGKAAVRLLENNLFDLLIVDLRLPDMAGWRVLETARTHHPQIRAIVITAYETEELAQALPLNGVDAVLYKPFDLSVLLSTVRSLMREVFGDLLQRGVAAVPMEAEPYVASRTPEQPLATPLPGLAVVVRPLESEELGVEMTQYVGRVLVGHETLFTVLTTPVSKPLGRVEIEYLGVDGQYRFQTAVVEVLQKEEESLWLLRKPTRIQRIQRRRHPRLAVHGQVTIFPLGERVLRTLVGELVDLSEGGMRVRAPRGLSQDTSVQVLVEWQTAEPSCTFEARGRIAYGIGRVQRGQIMYELGLQLSALPRAIRLHVRQRLYEALTGGLYASHLQTLLLVALVFCQLFQIGEVAS